MNQNMRQLLKLLLGAGLLLVEPGRREKAADKIKDRVDDWTGTAKEKYEDAMDRMERVTDAFAPAAGEETRNTIAEQASNIRDRVSEQASKVRDRVSEQASNIKEKVRDTVGRENAPAGSSERMPRTA